MTRGVDGIHHGADTRRPIVRPVVAGDMTELFDVRTSVRENHQSREELATIGVSEPALIGRLAGDLRGWLVEDAGRIRGFSMADRSDGSVFALFVRPEDEGRGFGTVLHERAIQWLYGEGFASIWLLTGSGTRAQRFYEFHRWKVVERLPEGDVKMEREDPLVAALR
jgi:GNAT superfamily N-acetyltransferase